MAKRILNVVGILGLAALIEHDAQNAKEKDRILKHVQRYTQSAFGSPAGSDCNTACCIAGYWAARSGDFGAWHSYYDTSKGRFLIDLPRITEELGLTPKQASALFDGRYDADGHSPLPEEAVEVLRKLATTGRVTWPGEYPRAGGVTPEDCRANVDA